MKQKSWMYYIVVLVIGALIGAAMGEIIAFLLPSGNVVQQFFLKSFTASVGPGTLDISILSFTLGFTIKINIISVIGILIAAYALRWTK